MDVDMLQYYASLSSWQYWMRFTSWFMLWTLAEYSMHRLMHYSHPWNPLYRLHRPHHLTPMSALTDKKNRWPKLTYFFFYFENTHETLEILLGETIPALCIYYYDPECGTLLLIFHYIYEILATDSLLEHNADISARWIINYAAVGQFHLEHHRIPSCNYGFTITLWDHIFGTYKYPSIANGKVDNCSGRDKAQKVLPSTHTIKTT